MDPQFLKFWGNFLLQAAEGQKRFEEVTRWMTAGFSSSEDLTEMFMEAYGLKRQPKAGLAQSKAWTEASAQFQQAFSDYLHLFGAVPRSRYEALEKEKAQLEVKVGEQAKTIRKLRLELGESRVAEGKVLDGFQQLMEVQSEQFRQVSERLGRFFSAGDGQQAGRSESSEEKTAKKRRGKR